jgi:prepilin-type N-terminal cleavage/methylation domain-containing protein
LGWLKFFGGSGLFHGVAYTLPFSSKYLERQSKHPSASRNGFTLIEVVVTLCIVAILTAIAIPGFKKATEDFRLNATLEDTVDIMKACRAYYLIFNEWPADAGDNIETKLCPFVPNRLMNPSKRWNRRPLNSTAYNYDWENFVSYANTLPHSVGISLIGIKFGTAVWDKCYLKFQPVIGGKYIMSRNDRMCCLMPECPGSTNPNSNTLWENRYY